MLLIIVPEIKILFTTFISYLGYICYMPFLKILSVFVIIEHSGDKVFIIVINKKELMNRT